MKHLLFLYIFLPFPLFSFIPNDPYLPWLNCAQQLAMNVPPALGKTHFILGYSHDRKTTQAAEKKITNPAELTGNCTVFFSPDDDTRSQLVSFIEQEKEAIKIAIFMFTDKELAQAIINSHKRGVAVEVVTDPAGLRDKQNKIGLLSDNKIDVYVYNGQHAKSGNSSIMHHKFILFSKNKNDKPLLWTGSLNFTRIACDCNQENVIIVEDNSAIEKYTEQFKKLKQRSYKYKVVEPKD